MDIQKSAKPTLFGRHIVTAPKICRGQPTFRGTRIFVADILEEVARGLAWQAIIAEWYSSITEDAITEVVQLAIQALLKHVDEFIGSHKGLSVWRLHAEGERFLHWTE